MRPNTNSIYRFRICPNRPGDPRSAGFLADAHALGISKVTSIRCGDLYFIEGQLNPQEIQRLADELLSDPVVQTVTWQEWLPNQGDHSTLEDKNQSCIEVALHPGVTDSVAEQIVRAAHEMGIQGVQRVCTGLQFILSGENLQAEDLHLLANRLLSNVVIQRYTLGEIDPAFPLPAESSSQVEIIPIRDMSAEQLLECSRQRRAALDIFEMKSIQEYFRKVQRDCSDIEFEMIAQTWSEHCVHKTFKAQIEVENADSTVVNNRTKYLYSQSNR